MKARITRVVADLLAVAAAGIVLLVARPGAVNYELALQFTVAIFILDLLDLWMPYGEPVPVDTALVVACLVLGGAPTALVASVVARSFVYLARRGVYRPEQMLEIVARRMISLAVCAALVEWTALGSFELVFQSLLLGTVLILLELLIAQLQAAPLLHERVSQLLAGNLQLQGSMLAAQLSIATLVVITYEGMGIWGLALMTLLVLLMRQSLSLVLEIRQAYRGTIEALVAAIEIQDPRRRGHARRAERFAHSLGLRRGIRGRELERLGYAALLHDVDLIGVDPGGDLAAAEASRKHSAEVIADVGFLDTVGPILRLCDGEQSSTKPSLVDAELAAIVALASDVDDAERLGTSVPGNACQRIAAAVGKQELERLIAVATGAGLIEAGTTR